MKRIAFALALLAPASGCGGAWAEDAWKDFCKSRPQKCREATARIVESTGGTFKAGNIDDTVEIWGTQTIIATIDCGTSDDAVSVTVDANVKYPSNEWFSAASRAGMD